MVLQWIDAGDDLPENGSGVLGAVSGRYAKGPGSAFWVVLPMSFLTRHVRGTDGREFRDCFVDRGSVIRFPYAAPDREGVTHWAYLPPLPGAARNHLVGHTVAPALQAAFGLL
ncbi:AQJ64_40280 family protein [Streptomyces sp. G-G2]|uniref:AQJ64_40280 family protein n=1 Tax=Streptomyces sp. G-G2 TaxID=3046201 RepID=UPI0024B8F846|nr:AQJ64_40280 family protein [Streptomyces sp. G-G2]MDJ0385733.1 AQJ64_40280 family protein [Streptomyces sp. G-G2]